MGATIGIVLSGGGARGAYEFGALEVLAPVLDEPARIVVGTSAGGLGAAYLAANAHHGFEAAARSGGEQWREVEIGDVIGPLWSLRELARLLLYGGAGINRHGEGDERALHRRSSDPRWPGFRRRRSRGRRRSVDRGTWGLGY